MTTKKCTKCGEEKPLTSEYFNVKSGNKDGFRNDCKTCYKAYQKEWYTKNKASVSERHKLNYVVKKELLDEYQEFLEWKKRKQ